MYVDLRTPGLRLPRGRAHALLRQVREAFHGIAGQVARVVVRVLPAGADQPALRDCAIEVHLRNGQVAVVQERQRRLVALLARALRRAGQMALRRTDPPAASRPAAPRLPHAAVAVPREQHRD
jgi:hypothetical protein